jgi:hypothetical protein
MGPVKALFLKGVLQIGRIVVLFVSFFRIAIETVLSIFGKGRYSADTVPLSISVV